MTFKRGWVFDKLTAGSQIGRLYMSAYNGTPTPSTDVPYGTGKSLSIGWDQGAICYLPDNEAGKTLFTLSDWKLTGARTGAFMGFADANNVQQFIISRGADRLLKVYRWTTLLASGTTIIPDDAWFTMQTKSLVHSSAGFVDIYLNGNPTPEISISNVNTQYAATNTVKQILLGMAASTNNPGYLWRLAYQNSDGTINNDLISRHLDYEIGEVVSDGSNIWTPNGGSTAYTQLDEGMGTPDDDTTYVKTSTLNNKNIVQVQANLLTNAASVVAVQHHARASRVGPGAIGIKSGTKIGAAEIQSSEKFLPAAYVDLITTTETKDGTNPYTIADINGSLELTTELTTVN